MDKPNDNAFIKRVRIKKDYMVFDNDKIDIFESHAENLGETLEDFINRAVKETMERDKYKEDKISFTLDKNKIKEDILKEYLEELEKTLDEFINCAMEETLNTYKEGKESFLAMRKEREEKEAPKTLRLNTEKIDVNALLGKYNPLPNKLKNLGIKKTENEKNNLKNKKDQKDRDNL